MNLSSQSTEFTATDPLIAPLIGTPSTRAPTDDAGPDQSLESKIDSVENLIDAALHPQLDSPNSSVKDAKPASRCKKLIIQIPCFNEEDTLGITLSALPRNIEGVESVEWLIVDDGSHDRTVDVANRCGVDHVVKLSKNQGLARAFMAGIEECLRQGADVIVNTDADNQYCADDIPKLIAPILEGDAEMVVGQRPIADTPHFSPAKKLLQKVGSWVVRKVSRANVADAPSGFRAMSRSTAMQLNVFNDYTYTLETLIQAGQKHMAVVSVPIRTNADLRPSRLLKSIPSYVCRSASTIARIFMTYRPLHFFAVPGAMLCLASFALCVRYLLFYLSGAGSGHIQSLILAGILMGAGLLGIVVGLVGDLISVNRKLLEKVDWRVRSLEDHVKAISSAKANQHADTSEARHD